MFRKPDCPSVKVQSRIERAELRSLVETGTVCYPARLDEDERNYGTDAASVVGRSLGGLMHYPRRNSKIKRARKQGFRARMRRRGGRKLINRKRRRGTHRVSVC